MGVADRINQLLTDPEAGLDRLLATIASIDQPRQVGEDKSGLSVEDRVVDQLDQMADACPDPGDPATVFDYVYGPLGFSGNLDDYYNPANSLIDRVLKRRRGIPLSLAAVVSEIGRRNGRDLRPVGLPGHVLLGEGPDPTRWFDPFNRGVALGVDDCRALFGRIHPVESFDRDMLRPMTGLEVTIRTLNNLRIAYAKQGDIAKMIPVLELRVELPPAQIGDRRELADLLSGLGRYDQAGDQYLLLAEEDPENQEAHEARYQACRAHQN
ncbi:MAG: transglutaminase-like domain-containing protein [Actinomycetota bacterium]